MTVSAMQRSIARLERACLQPRDLASLRAEVLHELRSVMTIDAAFFATVDPDSMLFTSGFAEAPLTAATPLFLENEFQQVDVNKFVTLAGATDPVGSLDRVRAGDRTSSVRFRELLAPIGLGDEARVALIAGGHCWGVLCLHREQATAGFAENELAHLRRIAPIVAVGLRRAALAVPADAPDTDTGPGVMVVDGDLSIVAINRAARGWLDELGQDDRTADGIPTVLRSVVAHARAGSDGATASVARLRTRRGRWVAVHASRAEGDGGGVALVLEPPNPIELSSIVLAAHGLTRAQSRVAALVVQGKSTRAIVGELHISANTVQEHLKAVFDRLGIGSRRELVAALTTQPH